MTLIQKLQSLLTRRDKKILLLITAVTICISVLEIITLSATMLFITSILKFKTLHTDKYVLRLAQYTGPLQNTHVICLIGISLMLIYLTRCTSIFIYTYYMQKFVETRKYILSSRFFNNYLRFNYKEFSDKNPAAINKLIFADAGNITTIISAGLILFSEICTLTLIYASLMFVNFKLTIGLTILLSTKVTLVLKLFSKKLAYYGSKVAMHSENMVKIYGESFRNFKLIKLLCHERYILSRFKSENEGLIHSNVMNKVLLETPRIALETIGFTILSGAVIYVVYRSKTPEHIIPILSMYALAFYRFMPSITKIINSYNQIAFCKGTLNLSNDLMYKSEELGEKHVSFKKRIQLKNISFAYEKHKNILQNTSFTINKQERIAFIGESGSGKSTLADIIMGFYLPETGSIHIDNKKLSKANIKSWRKKIGYIPQQIYLFDGTVAENIVFGRTYDKAKIITSLKKANIYDFLLTENGINTKVGEGGIRLSGGQMQRIAIARALYSEPEILVLDEATSALDNETETKIMNEIYNLNKDKTLIIIAHRLSTVLKCEKIYKIEDGHVFAIDKHQLHLKHIATQQGAYEKNV